MKKRHPEIPILIVLDSLMTLLAVSAILLSSAYPASEEVDPYLLSDSQVTVLKEDRITSFSPATSKKKGLVFYPGAKVEAAAYAPLCHLLAQEGYPTYLVRMPYNFALFDKSAASSIFESHSELSDWTLIGHSLGGEAAGEYAAKNVSKLTGIVFLASYTTADLSGTSLKALSIYGSEDGVFNRTSYTKDKAHLPPKSEEKVLSGGNHAGFGFYGPQSGDGQAQISALEQIQETVKALTAFLA
jgi:hypothetical protein